MYIIKMFNESEFLYSLDILILEILIKMLECFGLKNKQRMHVAVQLGKH